MKKIMVQWLEIICILAFSGLCIAGAEQLSENQQDEGVAFATFNKATNVARIGPEGRGLNRTIIVTNAEPYLDQVIIASKEMRVLVAISAEKGLAPQTILDAAIYISQHIGYSRPPDRCLEYDGVFYFSGGTTTKMIEDFSRGLAIKKGETTIYTW